jgi:Zn-dependent metalloprotease
MRTLPSLSAGLLALSLSPIASAANSVTAPVPGGTQQATTEASALRSLIAARPDLAGIEWGTPRVTVLSGGQRFVKFPQYSHGLRVAQRGAVVRFNALGQLEQVTAQVVTDLPANFVPTVSRADALRAVGAEGDKTEPVLALWPTADGTKLVWAVAPASLASFSNAPVIIVDAKTGEVILRYNAVLSLNKASVYPTNPTKSPTLAEVTLPADDGSLGLANASVKALNCIDNKTLKSTPFTTDKIHICDLVNTVVADQGTGDFLDQPGADTAPEDGFSEISIFHHTNRAYEFFRGFHPTLDVNNKITLPAISNLRIPQGITSGDATKYSNPNLPLAPFQNAFFAPQNPLFETLFGISGAAMWFGQGPHRDYSYDGDVVYHEFTHAVVEATLQLQGNPHLDEFGASMSPGAMNEGLADYFSSALAGDPAVGEYASGDFAPGAQAIRVLTDPDTCPTAVGGEVHQDSVLFSGALWDVRKEFSSVDQAKLDAAVYAAMNSASTGDLSYEDLAQLIEDAVRASPLGNSGGDKVAAAFGARGVLPKCSRVLEYSGSAMSGPQGLQGLWMAPGTQTTGTPKFAPGVVQFHQKLPAGTTQLAVNLRKVNVNSGGGGIFGGGTPFEPRLLVRFSADLVEFRYGPFKAAADVIPVDLDKDGNNYSASVEVPEGAEDAYVMVASTGQLDGAYTKVELTLTVPPPPVDSTPDAGTSPQSIVPVTKGCGCGGSAVDAMGLAAMAFGLLRLRRSKR